MPLAILYDSCLRCAHAHQNIIPINAWAAMAGKGTRNECLNPAPVEFGIDRGYRRRDFTQDGFVCNVELRWSGRVYTCRRFSPGISSMSAQAFAGTMASGGKHQHRWIYRAQQHRVQRLP